MSSLEITRNRAFSDAAVIDSLISRERDRFEFAIGLGDPKCGVPPFDVSPVRLRLWRWPWSEWPTFNRAVFERDMEGVLIFIVLAAIPPRASSPSITRPLEAGRGRAGRCESDACRVDIRVVVDDGEPTRIGRIHTVGLERLPADIQAAARCSRPPRGASSAPQL